MSHAAPAGIFFKFPDPLRFPSAFSRAMNRQILDHRGPEFQKLGKRVLAGIKTIFKTENPVFIYPSSGTGAWEASLTNTLSPGDHVLMVETGQFAVLGKQMADRLGLKAEVISTDWRIGADAHEIEDRLRKDKGHAIKAVCVVHNETSTGCRTRLDEVRKAMDSAKHPALLMTDSDLRPRRHGSPPRRMGRRRYRLGLAEGHDAPAGPVVHGRIAQGARGFEDREAAARLFHLGRHAVLE